MHENLGIAYCAEAATGDVVYEERLPRAGQVYAAPILAGGRIYYLCRDGKCFVVAARPKFELIATNELGERAMFNASPAVAGSRLLIRSDKTLYCIGKK
jgi:outer membrane protein assembly factor BamB